MIDKGKVTDFFIIDEFMVHLYISYVKKEERVKFTADIFRFSTKGDSSFLKLPESQIPGGLKSKIDFSALRTTTLKGKGEGYLIPLSQASDINGNPISGSLGKFRKANEEITVSLETIMPAWKLQLAKAGSMGKRWAEGFKRLVGPPLFTRAMTGVAILNISHALKEKDKGLVEYLDVAGNLFYLAELQRSYLLQRLAPNLMKRIPEKLFGTISIAAFTSVDLVKGIELIGKNQPTAGILAIVAGGTGSLGALGASGVLKSFLGSTTGPISIGLIILSFAASIIYELIVDTSLQELLKNCAYGNSYKLKAQSGIELLDKALKKKVSNDGLRPYLHEQQHTLNQLVYVELIKTT